MGPRILSAVEARRAAKQPAEYLLWVTERQAKQFQEPGWIKLEPPRDGAVLFLHRQRELRAARERDVP